MWVMSWPACNPDLLPNENNLSIIKQKIWQGWPKTLSSSNLIQHMFNPGPAHLLFLFGPHWHQGLYTLQVGPICEQLAVACSGSWLMNGSKMDVLSGSDLGEPHKRAQVSNSCGHHIQRIQGPIIQTVSISEDPIYRCWLDEWWVLS